MRKLVISMLALPLLMACGSEQPEAEQIKLHSFKDRISYALGADHARAISESGDKFFDQYDLDQLTKGFEAGLKMEQAFDETCKERLKKMFGENGNSFNASMVRSGSECIGKLSANFFSESWKQKGTFDKLNMDLVVKGFEQGLHKTDTLISRTEVQKMIQEYMFDLNKQAGIKMLEEVAKKPGIVKKSSGLLLETLQEGSGGSPAPSDDVLAHYILMRASGDTLQSSFQMVKQYNQPLTSFSLLQVVPGWQEGIPMMRKGGKYRLYLPYHLGYGANGMFNPNTGHYDIQPYEALIFYIELLDYGKQGSIKPKKF